MDNEIDWEEIFTAMGLEWKEKLSVIKLTAFIPCNSRMNKKKKSTPSFPTCLNAPVLANGREMYSFVARLAVNLCRIMSEVAVLRASKARSLRLQDLSHLSFHTGQGDSCGQPQR